MYAITGKSYFQQFGQQINKQRIHAKSLKRSYPPTASAYIYYPYEQNNKQQCGTTRYQYISGTPRFFDDKTKLGRFAYYGNHNFQQPSASQSSQLSGVMTTFSFTS